MTETTITDIASSNSLADLAARIKAAHEAVGAALRRGVQDAMMAGDLLIEAKAQLNHGQWLPWLRDHCAISERTARLYMRLARHREKIENGNVADLSVRGALEIIAVSKVSNDKLVTGLIPHLSDVFSGELELAAYEVSQAACELRMAAYRQIFATLDRINQRRNTTPAAYEAAHDDEGCRLRDELMSLVSDIRNDDSDEPFYLRPVATAAVTKAVHVATTILRRIEAASEPAA